MARRNVLRGGGKANKAAVTGLKDLERKLKAMMPDNPQMAAFAQEAVAQGAKAIQAEMLSTARAAGWGSAHVHSRFGKFAQDITGEDVLKRIFSYGKPKPAKSGRMRVTALAGVTKAGRGGNLGSMFSWRAGKHPKSARAKVAAGNEVAMSLATALEFGTSRQPAKPAIRQAIKSGQPRVLAMITDKFQAIYQRFAQ